MAVTTVIQTTAVDEIGSVVITDTVLDVDTYRREIRVYGEPDVNGNVLLQFTLRLSSTVAAKIELVAPSQRF